jgi:microcystin-dependent protein
MADPFIGEIRMVGFSFAPVDWADADGQLIAISQNNALYSLYGTTYGGDGQKDFALPDLRGRAPIHCGKGPGLPEFKRGQHGGSTDVVLSEDELPSHEHAAKVNAKAAEANQGSPTGHYWAQLPRNAVLYSDSRDTPMAADAVEVAASGGGQAHANMQPYLTIRFCVSLAGLYPRRN